MKQDRPTDLRAALAIATVVGLAAVSSVHLRAEEEDLSSLIQRVVAHVNRSGATVKAVRELRAGTVNGKHQGWMTVETVLTPTAGLSWNVLEEGGSERTREKVFYALLKTEAEACRKGDDAAALTPANYEFTPLPRNRAGQIRIQLTPKREDARLVEGVLTVAPDGSPIRLEGKLAKAPSFWVKSVTVVKQFGRFGGVSLPTSVESLADIRMVGRATFTMRYRYSEIDGRTVSHAVASAPFVGPSAEILALHNAGSEQ